MRKFLFLFLILITGCSEDRAIEIESEKESKPLSSIKFYLHCTYNPQLISDDPNARSNNSFIPQYSVMDIRDEYDYLLVFSTPDSEHKNENIDWNESVEPVTRAEMDMSMIRIYGDHSSLRAGFEIIDELNWPITIFENTSFYMFDEFNGKLGILDRTYRNDYRIHRETLVMTRAHSNGLRAPSYALSQCSIISAEEHKIFYESWLEITKTNMDRMEEERQAQEDKNKI